MPQIFFPEPVHQWCVLPSNKGKRRYQTSNTPVLHYHKIINLDRVTNVQIRKLSRIAKEVDESFLWWFERIVNDRIAKRAYMGESVDSCLVGHLQKR